MGLDWRLALVLIALFGFVVGDSLLWTRRTSEEGFFDECDFGPPEIVLVTGVLFYPAWTVTFKLGCAQKFLPKMLR